MTQTEEFYEYMRKYGSITPFEAFHELGIMRLASRIADLKKAKIGVNREMIEVKARNGRKAHVAQYSLIESEVENGQAE